MHRSREKLLPQPPDTNHQNNVERGTATKQTNNNNNNNNKRKNKERDRQTNKPSESEQPSLYNTTENDNNSTTVDQPTPQTPCAAVTNPPTLPPKATDRSAKNENIKIITQNVQGLRSEEKIEYIIRLMKNKNIQAYLI
jgi:hypothetical protein